jgi:molecular chaperone GrpE (heat shock protein)
MLKLLRRWFRRPPGAEDDAALRQRSEAQAQRLELQEREHVIAALTADLERQRRGEEERIAQALHAHRERFLADAAGPVAQLLTQAHLIDVEGKPVQARDVLAVARRLVRLLEDEGLLAEGQVGATVPFDPDRHEPAGGELAPGQFAVVRFVGLTYRGRVLRKAGVTPP